MTLLIVLLLVVFLFGGGWYGYHRGWDGTWPSSGIVGLVILILVIVLLFGNIEPHWRW
jgi:hypothetical protein